MLVFLITLFLTVLSIGIYLDVDSRRNVSLEFLEFLIYTTLTLVTVLILMTGIIVLTQTSQNVKAERLENDRQIVQVQINRINKSEDGDYALKGDFGSLEDVYSRARRINNDIITSRHWRENIWVNWFFNRANGDVELIEFE